MATQQPPGKVWTYDDLADIEYEGRKYEIFDGELVVSSSPSLSHQEVVKRLVAILLGLETRKIAKVFFAPLDVVLSPTKVFQPDILAVSWARRRTALAAHGVVEAPDLAIEVLSPSNKDHDRVFKRNFYARNRVAEYWIVDPIEKTIEVLLLIEGGLSYRTLGRYAASDRARSATFDFDVEIDALFATDDE
jgi:Uma2 family endonuclease